LLPFIIIIIMSITATPRISKRKKGQDPSPLKQTTVTKSRLRREIRQLVGEENVPLGTFICCFW